MQVPKSDTSSSSDTASSDLWVRGHMCGCKRERGTVCGAEWDYISGQEIKKNTFQDVIQSNEETETSENMFNTGDRNAAKLRNRNTDM